MLKVDLHCHSTVSDGVLAPSDVAAYARKLREPRYHRDGSRNRP